MGIVQKSNWNDPHRPCLVMLKDGFGGSANEEELDLAQYEYARIRMIF